jgi:asparagine synthase (glutamine-hydrolysing)
LYDFLTYRYIPAPKTMYQDVFKLEPGAYLSVRLDGTLSPRIRTYWKLDPKVRSIGLNDAKAEFRRLLAKSVREQMVADVPVGFFLSGGIDSSSVVACAAEQRERLHTFSIGFSEKKHDETGFAALMAQRSRTIHKTQILDVASTQSMFPRLKEWYDEPFADLSAFPSYLVASFARESVTVVLTGDGGDEICGGYNWYAFFNDRKASPRPVPHPLARLTGQIKGWAPPTARRALNYLERNFLSSDLEVLARYLGGMVGAEKRSYAEAWDIPADYDDLWLFRRHYREDLTLRTRMQALDFHTFLPNDILTKVDRTTMSVSLEARLPLLSRELVEFCFSLPEEIRYAGGELKGIMKSAMEELLPREILQREKKGFSIPNKAWRADMASRYATDSQRILHEVFQIPEPNLVAATGRG